MRAFGSILLLPLLHTVFAAPNPAPTTNEPTLVKVRIEGEAKTIFEDFVTTRGHDVNRPSGGKHHCDGTNFNANPTPGPTCTSALDDAARLGNFKWDGSYYAEYDDYFIEKIAGQNQMDTQYWGLYLNYKLTEVGGCRQQVKPVDEVLWAFDAFNKKHVLKLTGPTMGLEGQPIKLVVTDGGTGTPLAGVTVHGQTTNDDGEVIVSFTEMGVYLVKAEKEDSIRSAALSIAIVQ